ncbi:hypothetical protein HPULCUR_000135 [Helicostylum pulchrum]|uniref:Pentacotripeptide-repeat region of PRORP domain-containing protein n=1 Tax=Helicostylum pulchrum TaxID=562976 RepID=A0ABP9XIZ4_9FUNG
MFQVLDSAAAARKPSNSRTLSSILQLEQDLRQSGEQFNSETYEHILSAYAKSDEDKSLELYERMVAEGIKPTRVYYHKALQLVAKSGDAVTQAKILHYMENDGYKPTSKTYHLMLLCMRENAELERALDTFELMRRQNITPGLLTYLSVIDMAVNLHQPDIASQLLEQAEQLPTFREKDQIFYMHILRSASFHGFYEISKLNWKRAVNDCNFKPDEGVCLQVLNLAGEYGDPVLASDVIRVLGEEGYQFRECHFSPLIEAFASTGDMTSTFKVFIAMRKVGVIPTKKTAIPIAHKLGSDINAVRKARDSLLEMAKDQQVDTIAFNLIIHCFAYNKEYDEAVSIFARAKEFGVKPDSETLDAVLDACIHCKDASLGEMLYREQLSRGIKGTPSTMSKMVTLMCTQEDYEGAFKYLEKMKKLNMIPLRGCYFKLVKVLSAANDPRLPLAIEDMKAYGYDISSHMEDYMEREIEKRLNAVEEEEISFEQIIPQHPYFS